MSAPINETQLKELLKSAMSEVLEERREFVKEIFEEAIENIGLRRAIDEGISSGTTSREDVFKILDTSQ
jgi:Fe-S cluster assembly ATPase SufC